MSEGPAPDRRSVLARAVALLDAFGESDSTLPVAELVRRVALPKSTVHRMVSELVEHGFLERDGRDVTLGVHLFELGCRVPAQRRLRETGLPFMEDLYETTHEAVLLGILDTNAVLCIVRINSHDGVVPVSEGQRIPAHATAMGKAMLAFSPRAAVGQLLEAGLRPLTPYTIVVPHVLVQDLAWTCRTGVAFDREEAVIGGASVAAPILDATRTVLGALAVSGPAHRFDPGKLADAVRVASAGIARSLSGLPSRRFRGLRGAPTMPAPGQRRRAGRVFVA